MDNDRLISHQFIRTHTVEAARVLETLAIEEISSFLEDMPPALAADLIRLLNSSTSGECLDSMSLKSCASIMERLPVEIGSVLLRRLRSMRQEDVLSSLPTQKTNSLRLILQYPQETAGALMDPQVFNLPDDITVFEALKRIQKNPQHVIYYLYILNREQILTGFLTIRQLMVASSGDKVPSIMYRNEYTLSPEMTYRSILINPGWSELHALPVVDKNGIFLGTIGYKTLRYLEKETEQRKETKAKFDAGVALGELYWIGLSSFLKGAASTVDKEK